MGGDKEPVPPALTIAILGAIESLLSATVADGVIGDHHDSNTELIGQALQTSAHLSLAAYRPLEPLHEQ